MSKTLWNLIFKFEGMNNFDNAHDFFKQNLSFLKVSQTPRQLFIKWKMLLLITIFQSLKAPIKLVLEIWNTKPWNFAIKAVAIVYIQAKLQSSSGFRSWNHFAVINLQLTHHNTYSFMKILCIELFEIFLIKLHDRLKWFLKIFKYSLCWEWYIFGKWANNGVWRHDSAFCI